MVSAIFNFFADHAIHQRTHAIQLTSQEPLAGFYDLARGAAKMIGFERAGTAIVEIERLE